MMAGVDKEELVLLKFTETEKQTQLKWKHAKEFEYHGQMYDIVEMEIKGDTTFYWCWWDNKETRLNKQVDELLAYALGKDSQHTENQSRLLTFYKSLFCQQLPDWDLFAIQAIQMPTAFELSYLSVSHPPPVPPPELF